ncbi:MAG TPA: hypothetical protein VMW73_16990 [Spirochaetia bacterium]|nr:hypothetical protein [Spirochaetia bacterium]
MGIAAIVIGGVIVVTIIASVSSYLTEKAKRRSPEVEANLSDLEKRLAVLESRMEDRDERVAQIANDLKFVNRLIEQGPDEPHRPT